QGTMAEKIAVPASMIVDLPESISFEDAAALPVAGITAYRSLVTRGGLKRGEHVWVTGIGGGVATLAMLFAKALGAQVSVTSGSEPAARGIGADGEDPARLPQLGSQIPRSEVRATPRASPKRASGDSIHRSGVNPAESIIRSTCSRVNRREISVRMPSPRASRSVEPSRPRSTSIASRATSH